MSAQDVAIVQRTLRLWASWGAHRLEPSKPAFHQAEDLELAAIAAAAELAGHRPGRGSLVASRDRDPVETRDHPRGAVPQRDHGLKR